MRKQLFIAAFSAALAALGQAADASVLFGANTDTPTIGDIYRIDDSTGAIAPVGPSGFSFIGDLTSDPATQRIWGTDLSSNALVNINRTTGAGIAVGNYKLVTGAPAPVITSLAYDPISATLYGTTSQTYSSVPDQLYRIDPATATVTPVGSALIGHNDVWALAFSTTGQLYGISNSDHELLQINTTTGVGNVVATVQINFAFDMAARPEDGMMFVTNSANPYLYTMDLTTGAVTGVGPMPSGTNIVGLAFIPEPGSLALLGVGGASLLLRRRR